MAKDIVIHYGTLDMLETRIQSVAIERTKAIMSSYTADSIIEQRAVISSAVSEAVEAAVGTNYYIDITNIALTNIDFSDAYEKSVEDKMIAQQNKLKQDIENEAKIAAAEADKKVKQEAADADAYTKEKAAEAEANAIAIKSLEVARMLGLTVIDPETSKEVIKPNLTDAESQLIADYLKYVEYLATWDGKLPTVMGNGTSLLYPLENEEVVTNNNISE